MPTILLIILLIILLGGGGYGWRSGAFVGSPYGYSGGVVWIVIVVLVLVFVLRGL